MSKNPYEPRIDADPTLIAEGFEPVLYERNGDIGLFYVRHSSLMHSPLSNPPQEYVHAPNTRRHLPIKTLDDALDHLKRSFSHLPEVEIKKVLNDFLRLYGRKSKGQSPKGFNFKNLLYNFRQREDILILYLQF